MKPPNETRLQRWTPINQADGETDQALRTRDGRCPGSRRCLPACLPAYRGCCGGCCRATVAPSTGRGGLFCGFPSNRDPVQGLLSPPLPFRPVSPCLISFLFCFVFSFLLERCPGHAGFEGLHIPCRRSSVAACTCYVAGGIRAASDIFSLFSRLAVTFRCRRNAVAALYPA